MPAPLHGSMETMLRWLTAGESHGPSVVGIIEGMPAGVAVTSGDIQEALDSAKAVGDDRIQQKSGQGVDPEGWTHGSSEQRMAWFTRGYEEGTLEACDTFSASSL